MIIYHPLLAYNNGEVLHFQLNKNTGCSPVKDVCKFEENGHMVITNDDSLMTGGSRGQVSCKVVSECLNETLSELPDGITSLTVTIDRFPNTSVSFSRFTDLRKLAILWKFADDKSLRKEQNELTDSGLFAGLNKLESLRISIPTSIMDDALLIALESLRYLDLSNIGYFSTAKFATLFKGSRLENKPLETLILKQIAGVNTARDRLFLLKELFPLLNANLIKELDLSDNRAIDAYPGLTQYLPHLEIFNVRGNAVRYINESGEAICLVLELLLHENIKLVDMSEMGNIGKEIDFYGVSFIFDVYNCVLNASWAKNHCVCENFQKTCGSFFSGKVNCEVLPEFTLQEIAHLNPVQHNPERYCDWRVNLPYPKSLEILRFSKTQLIFPQTKWYNRTLCFLPNNLTILDLSYITFDPSTDTTLFVGWDRLTTMDLAYSNWGSYFHYPQFLHKVPRLEVLNMTGTNIGIYIKNDTNNQIFEKSVLLKDLRLGEAQISFIPLKEVKNLHQLETLDLSGNELMQLSFLVSPLWSLSLLNLSHNALYQLTPNATESIDVLLSNRTSTLHIDLQFNPFTCDCLSRQFINWISITKADLLGKDMYLCTYQGQRQMTLVAVDYNQLTIDCYMTYIATFSVGGIALIIIITIFLVYKYRWRLRTWLLKVTNATKGKGDSVPYKYHAFVVYSDEDRQWVHNIMMDEIENVRKMNLCVHHRDFIPGEYIDEQIVSSVDNSRKTLLILTKNFLASDWCMYEMRVARNKLQAEGKDVIIPILLAELPEEYMNLSVKNLLREKTYLQWETSMGGQEYFWKKLEIALRCPNKIRKRKQIQVAMSDDNDDNEALVNGQ